MSYEKHLFEDGQVLTAEMLNQMNDGIGAANNYKVVDLVLFIGQSNMAGRGVASQAPVVPEGQGYEFRAMSDPTKLYPITEPFGKNENNSASGVTEGIKTGSMVSAFAIEYYKNTGVPIVGVSCSKGDTSVTFWAAGGKPFNDAVARHNAAKKWLTDNGYTVRHDFAVWCQGEADPKLCVDDTYNNYMKNMISQMKTHGVEKWFISRVGHHTDHNNYDVVIAAQNELCKTYDDAIMASCLAAGFRDQGLMKDVVHYTQPGYNILGADCAKNAAFYWNTGVEPYMYDPNIKRLYFPYGDVNATIEVDETLNSDSANAIQNKAVATALNMAMLRIDELTDKVFVLEAGGEDNLATVTLNLTNVMAATNTTRAIKGKPYQNNLTPINGCNKFSQVVVTMNGEDITTSAYSDGVISIENVNGDIQITAVGENVLLDLDFGNFTLSNYVDNNILSEDIKTDGETIQDENGLCLNGTHPSGFALSTPVAIPDKWTLEYEVKHPVDTVSGYGIMGSDTGSTTTNKLAPCILKDGSAVQIRFNKDDAGRAHSDAGYLVFDGDFHTYKIDCIGNYTLNLYRDGTLIQENLKYSQGNPTGNGSWTRVLGVSNAYVTFSPTFATDGNFYCKRIKITAPVG
jgi:hypothetical protein